MYTKLSFYILPLVVGWYVQIPPSSPETCTNLHVRKVFCPISESFLSCFGEFSVLFRTDFCASDIFRCISFGQFSFPPETLNSDSLRSDSFHRTVLYNSVRSRAAYLASRRFCFISSFLPSEKLSREVENKVTFLMAVPHSSKIMSQNFFFQFTS